MRRIMRFVVEVAGRGWHDEYLRGVLIGGLMAISGSAVAYYLDGPMSWVGLAGGWVIVFLILMPCLEMLLEAKGFLDDRTVTNSERVGELKAALEQIDGLRFVAKASVSDAVEVANRALTKRDSEHDD